MSASAEQVLLPAPEGWNLWQFNGAPPVAQPRPGRLPGHAALRVGLPVKYVHAVPLWVVKTDEATRQDLVLAQLERRGLVSSAERDQPLRISPVVSEGDRDLILANLLSPHLPEEACPAEGRTFHPVPFLLPLPPDRLVIWPEQGSLAMAITRGAEIVYYQAISRGELDADALSEIGCALLQLKAEGALATLAGATLWMDVTPEVQRAASDALALPVEVAAFPAPSAKTETAITPPAVLQARIGRGRAARRRRLLGLASLALLVTALVFVGRYFQLRWSVNKLRGELAAVEPAVNEMKQTAVRWQRLEHAHNRELYPLERLHQAALILPPEGVRLTLFEQRADQLLIRGEAMNAPAAYKYHEDLKASPAWAGYDWAMVQPKLLPNNSAQFQIEGKRKTYAPPPTE